MNRISSDTLLSGPIALLAGSLLCAGLLCRAGLEFMAQFWFGQAEYSHAPLIPVISLYLIWIKGPEIRRLSFVDTKIGPWIVSAGIIIFFAGELSALFVITQYAFLVIVYGLIFSTVGIHIFKRIFTPLLILFFMIPLPNFIFNNLSAALQLLSSEIGVLVIRGLGISVFLEGNVIDLGSFKLQVVEACSGLRYLFPLMTLGFIVAYLFKTALWKRALIFATTIPITVLMNSFRIGAIGVLVSHWGQKMAEGFLHYFEGWVIFMACFAILFIEMIILMRLTGDRRSLAHVFGHDPVQPARPETVTRRRISGSLYISSLLVLVALVATMVLPGRQEAVPLRRMFTEFPVRIGVWHGTTEKLEEVFIEALKFTDYSLVNYTDGKGHLINFYAAYYESQRKGESVHSPRSCLPGGGWKIEAIDQVTLPTASHRGRALRVNRVLISQGDQRELVYYWFQERGRILTNEFLVKWDLLEDALVKNRTDGALIRLVMLLPPDADLPDYEARLSDFAAKISPLLPEYVPD